AQRLRARRRLLAFLAPAGAAQREPEVVDGRDAVRLFVHRRPERVDGLRVALLLKMDLPEIDPRAGVPWIHLQYPLERGARLIHAASRALDEAKHVQRPRVAGQQAR